MRPHQKLVDLARQHGWRFDGRTHYEYEITILVRDRRVRLSAFPGWRSGEYGLEVRVETPPPGLPRFTISRTELQGVFGDPEVEIGVPWFDRDYTVCSPEPDELRRVWTAERCQLVKDRLVGMSAHATHERLIVEVRPAGHVGRTLDDDAIVDALQLALDLAHAEVYGIAALSALPEAVLRQDGGPHVALAGPAPIVVRPVRDEDRVFTRATMQGTLPSTAPSTSALGKAQVASDGEVVTVSWPSVEEDPARLMTAIELLRSLTSVPSDGAYR